MEKNDLLFCFFYDIYYVVLVMKEENFLLLFFIVCAYIELNYHKTKETYERRKEK